MTRVYHYAEDTAAQTTTSATDQVKVTLAFTPTANSSYLYIWSAQISSASTSSDVRVSLKSGATVIAAGNIEDQDTTDWHPASGIVRESFGSSPSAVTLTLNWNAESGASAGIREARIIALRLESGDVYVENTDDQSNTTTTFSTAATLNWTPASTGDYLLLGSAEYAFSATGEVITRFVHGGTSYGETTARPKDVTNYMPGMHAVYLTGLSGAQTATVQWARSATAAGTASCRRAALVALRIGGFLAAYQGNARARATTTSASAVVCTTTGAITPVARPHLVIAACVRDHNATNNSARTVIAESNTNRMAVTEQEAVVASTTIDVPAGMWAQMMVLTPQTPNSEFDLRYYSESSGTSTGITDAQIAALQLEDIPRLRGFWAVNGVTVK